MSDNITAPFALGTFASPSGETFAAVVAGGRAYPLASMGSLFLKATTIRGLLEDWDASFRALDMAAPALRSDPTLKSYALEDLRPLPPVESRQIFCTGANYKKHVADLGAAQPPPGEETSTYEERWAKTYAMMEERSKTGRPYAFVKLASALIGANDDIVLPSDVKEPDWELELAVVIGKGGYRIPRAEAMAHVAGYCIANDVSARDFIYRPDMKAIGTDWLASKNRPTFLPLGPVIVPAGYVADPHDVAITLKLNGKVMQNESTADMIFDIPRQIEHISSLVRLMPGDVICTGSPAGNGTHHGVFMQPGDLVDGAITGLGRQLNRCVAE